MKYLYVCIVLLIAGVNCGHQDSGSLISGGEALLKRAHDAIANHDKDNQIVSQLSKEMDTLQGLLDSVKGGLAKNEIHKMEAQITRHERMITMLLYKFKHSAPIPVNPPFSDGDEHHLLNRGKRCLPQENCGCAICGRVN